MYGEDEASETDQKPDRKGRKRSGFHSKSKDPKRPTTECPECEIRDHNLRECWYIFKELKPEGRRLSAHRARQVKKALTDNEVLKKEVDKIRVEMKKNGE